MVGSEAGRLVLALWDFDEPIASRSRFHEAALILQTQVARACGLAGEFDIGHQALDAIDSAEGEPAVRVLLERGRLYRSGGDVAAAVPLFEGAYELAVAQGFAGLAADAAHMLAIVLPQEHEQWARRGLAAASGVDDPLAQAMTAAILNNLGWTLADENHWEKAYSLFDKAVAARETARRSLDTAATAKALHVARWTRARAARELGRHDEALAELRELAKSAIGAADAYVQEEIELNEAARAA